MDYLLRNEQLNLIEKKTTEGLTSSNYIKEKKKRHCSLFFSIRDTPMPDKIRKKKRKKKEVVTIAERKSNRYVIEISVFYFNADTLHAHYELAQKKGVGEKKKHTYTFFFFFYLIN